MVYTIYYFIMTILLFSYLFLLYKYDENIGIFDVVMILIVIFNMYLPIYELNNIKDYYGKLLIENNITVNKYKKDYNNIKVELYRQKLKGE